MKTESVENIRLFAGIYGMKEQEIERKTEELLDRLELTAERDTLVKSLPVGWKQKLAFQYQYSMNRESFFWMSRPVE